MREASAKLLSCRPALASLLTPLRLTVRCCTGDEGRTLGVKENVGTNLGGEEGPPAGSDRSWRLDAGRQVLQGEGKSSIVEDYVAMGEVLTDEDSGWE